jgi:16S rRNA (guanine(966)-N(2))-methyltransferase RsmD
VRKALFDILAGNVEGSYVLELFAGSGAVGIEVLSNGASGVVFVEKEKRYCKIIEDNLLNLGLISKGGDSERNIFVLAMDALRAIEVLCKKNEKFDIIFLDPPYLKNVAPRFGSGLATISNQRSLAKKVLQKISAYDILAPRGLIAVEHSNKDFIDSAVNTLTCFKQKRYADTILSFYERSS